MESTVSVCRLLWKQKMGGLKLIRFCDTVKLKNKPSEVICTSKKYKKWKLEFLGRNHGVILCMVFFFPSSGFFFVMSYSQCWPVCFLIGFPITQPQSQSWNLLHIGWIYGSQCPSTSYPRCVFFLRV